MDGFCGSVSHLKSKSDFDKGSRYCFTAMGGPCEIRVEKVGNQEISLNDIVKACVNEVKRLESKYSRYISTSVLSKINQQAGELTRVDPETASLLNYAETAYIQSNGLFDITSAGLQHLWNFKHPQLPAAKQIKQALNLIGWNKIRWTGKSIQLAKGMEIDLGGVVKEYAADALVAIARQLGVTSGYVSLSGDVAIIGPKYKQLQTVPWEFGICDPEQPDKAKATIKLFDGGLASSGDYERYFIVNGKRYCHVINPLTGYPSQGVAGVSVHSTNCITAGTLTTIAMLKGPEKGDEWLASNGLDYVMFPRI